jgi:hypothetical protein
MCFQQCCSPCRSSPTVYGSERRNLASKSCVICAAINGGLYALARSAPADMAVSWRYYLFRVFLYCSILRSPSLYIYNAYFRIFTHFSGPNSKIIFRSKRNALENGIIERKRPGATNDLKSTNSCHSWFRLPAVLILVRALSLLAFVPPRRPRVGGSVTGQLKAAGEQFLLPGDPVSVGSRFVSDGGLSNPFMAPHRHGVRGELTSFGRRA